MKKRLAKKIVKYKDKLKYKESLITEAEATMSRVKQRQEKKKAKASKNVERES